MKAIEKYEAIRSNIEYLEKNLFDNVLPVDEVMALTGIRVKKVPYNSRQTVLEDTSDWDVIKQGAAWGEPDTHFCFQLAIDIPESFRGREVLFFLTTGAEDIWNTDNPQMLVYINGKRRCGMDMNHNSVTIFEKEDWESEKDRRVDIRIYAYSNLAQNDNFLNMTIAARNDAVCRLYFDMKVPFEAMQAMLGVPSSKRESVLDTTAGAFEEQNQNVEISERTFSDLSVEYKDSVELILNGLYEAGKISINEVDINAAQNTGSLIAASEYLRENLYGKGRNPAVVKSVGHTHIDVAWKWRIRQTREKVIRSYSTVMELMRRYPEYKFMASTPQMYEYVREDEPELFNEIKEKVKEKRFEPEGAMWLEADCNLTSGESLVRQILYGKEYFKETFGVDSKVLWLPDVFGYSAALPQILKKSKVEVFMTTKLAWNDTNRMPNDFFIWEGIDGSSIPTYIITACDYNRAKEAEETGGILNYTYNGRQNASQTMGTWKAFREKGITDKVLTCYGYGDGGGGPTWEMLEMDRRLALGVPGVPRTEQTSVAEFFDELIDNTKAGTAVPKWKGELYLEFHRGTYTSIGKNKRNNRRAEYLMAEAELLSVCAFLSAGRPYPRFELKELWKKVMLNQFHDILPGSSIEEVYDDSDRDYAEIESRAKKIIDEASKAAGNNLAKDKEESSQYAEKRSGASGMTISRTEAEIRIANEYYEIVFDNNAEIISLYDKEARRELRPVGEPPLNRLIAFEDKPKEYDCWNIDADFENVSWEITDAEAVEIICSDRQGNEQIYLKSNEKRAGIFEIVVRVKRHFRHSVITQEIHVAGNARRIDFKTKADWHEHQTLLKASFPLNINTDEINCDIQYGSLSRSLKKDSSLDRAKFECCAHKWIDMSDKDGSYGAAILNDCKYGYDAKEKLMRLTLIKSGIYPNPNADQGEHEFTYSLFLHKGDYRGGRVIEEARALNEKNHLPIPWEPEKIISLPDNSGIYVEAVKLAEKSDEIIIRMYEGHGEKKTVTAKLLKAYDVSQIEVSECDLLESELSDSEIRYDAAAKEIAFAIKPYEIKTIKLKLS